MGENRRSRCLMYDCLMGNQTSINRLKIGLKIKLKNQKKLSTWQLQNSGPNSME